MKRRRGRATGCQPATILRPRVPDDAAAKQRARVALATHDQSLIGRICEAAKSNHISMDSFEFQMLYGIRKEALSRLAAAGYRTRVLISYGPAWYAWYMRRLAERPANVLFVLRNLLWS